MSIFRNVDKHQLRPLVLHALKHEFRISNIVRRRGRKKFSPWNMVFALLGYLLLGLVFINLFLHNRTDDGFNLGFAILSAYVGLVTAANIFLSFGSGFLSPDEAVILSPFPITSETFFVSRILVLLLYTTIISTCISLAGMVLLGFLAHPILGPLSILLVSTLTSIATAMMVVVLYGTVLIRFKRAKLTKLFSYIQFAGSLFTSASFVVLPRAMQSSSLYTFTLAFNPKLIWLPYYWFAGIGMAVLEDTSQRTLLVAAIAILATITMIALAFWLLASTYLSSVQEISDSATESTKALRPVRTEKSAIASLLLRTHESRATWLLFRAQFRYDTKFRLAILSSIPVTGIYVVLAVLNGSILDPFLSSPFEGLQATALYIVALISPFMIMQQISQSQSFKASWIFFASPVDRSKLLLSVRNIVFSVLFVPYMVLLFGVFSYYMEAGHAFRHVLMIATIALLVFQSNLLISPKVPFSEQRTAQRSSYTTFLWGILISAGPLGLLFLAMYYGYRTPQYYWSFLVLYLTLAVFAELFLRQQLSRRLEAIEYAG